MNNFNNLSEERKAFLINELNQDIQKQKAKYIYQQRCNPQYQSNDIYNK